MNWGELDGLFITGTDTGVGKTYVSTLLLRELRANCYKALPFKPICSGSLDDVQALQAACDGILELSEITPYYYQSPVAPLAASQIEGFEIDLDDIVAKAKKLQAACDLLIVEGVGGWEVPLAENVAIPDLAKALGYPILLVVDNRLGALNHTILTLKAIERAGLSCLGLILNHIQEERDLATVTNRALLERLVNTPILGEILSGADWIDWHE